MQKKIAPEPTVWCKGCGAEINWAPVIVDQHYFCCEDCANGLPCQCGERMEWEDDHKSKKDAVSPIYPVE